MVYRQVCVVLTTGIQTYNEHYQQEYVSMSDASQPLKDKDVHVFSVGVGDDIEVMSLIEIATTPDYVFTYRSKSAVVKAIKKIKKTKC